MVVFKTLVVAGLIAAAPSLALPTPAVAKAFRLGPDAAVIAIPDSWEPAPFDNGVEANSPDKATYVAAEIVKTAALKDADKAVDSYFARSGIKVDPASKTERDMIMGGLPAYDVSWNAIDRDGPTHVSLTLVKLDASQCLLLTYWGTAAGETSNARDLAAIADSIKPIKPGR
jgi:hypothetical protein